SDAPAGGGQVQARGVTGPQAPPDPGDLQPAPRRAPPGPSSPICRSVGDSRTSRVTHVLRPSSVTIPGRSPWNIFALRAQAVTFVLEDPCTLSSPAGMDQTPSPSMGLTLVGCCPALASGWSGPSVRWGWSVASS